MSRCKRAEAPSWSSASRPLRLAPVGARTPNEVAERKWRQACAKMRTGERSRARQVLIVCASDVAPARTRAVLLAPAEFEQGCLLFRSGTWPSLLAAADAALRVPVPDAAPAGRTDEEARAARRASAFVHLGELSAAGRACVFFSPHVSAQRGATRAVGLGKRQRGVQGCTSHYTTADLFEVSC